MKNCMKNFCMFAVIVAILCLLGPVVHAEAAVDWAFSTQDGKEKPSVNGMITLLKDVCLDMNVYRNGKEIKADNERYSVKWYSSDSDVVYVDKLSGEMITDMYDKMSEDIAQAKITAVIKNHKTGSMTKKHFTVRVITDEKAIPETPASAFRYWIKDGEVTIYGLKDKSLTEIRIPETIEGYPVSELASKAFHRTKLSYIVFPDTLKEIYSFAFAETPWLAYQKKTKDYIVINNILYWVSPKLSGEFVVPDGITSIHSFGFQKCRKLTSVIIPDSVTKVGVNAFEYCSNLKNVVLSENMTCIDYDTFYNCISLENIYFPDGITSINFFSFAFCENLKSIRIPESVSYIENPFRYCDNLSEIIVAEGSYAEQWAKENGYTDILVIE